MLFKRYYKTAGATFFIALATGYVMQNGDALASRFANADANTQPTKVIADVQLAAAEIVAEVETGVLQTPPHSMQPAPMPMDKSGLADRVNRSEQYYTTPNLRSEQQYSPFGMACEVALSATKSAGAMVSLDLNAPCHANESVTVRHEGLVFTVATSSVGQFSISVPAMVVDAVFDAEVQGGKTSTSAVKVPKVAGFDRVAVQWTGDNGLKIHALELGAGYGDSGHVWADAPQSVTQALQARGGYITALGDVSLPNSKHAEVYSFPTGHVTKSGVVRLSVEAEVTANTCGKQIEAQALQSEVDGGVSVVDLTLSMPSCDAIGDFLVLNNLLRDLKIAQN